MSARGYCESYYDRPLEAEDGGVCDEHHPVLSEPSLTLCCSACGAWLRETTTGVEVVPRAEATRGTHQCPRCKAEWSGDEDWCEACELPTWAPEADDAP